VGFTIRGSMSVLGNVHCSLPARLGTWVTMRQRGGVSIACRNINSRCVLVILLAQLGRHRTRSPEASFHCRADHRTEQGPPDPSSLVPQIMSPASGPYPNSSSGRPASGDGAPSRPSDL